MSLARRYRFSMPLVLFLSPVLGEFNTLGIG